MSAPSLSWTRYWAAGVVVVLSALLALGVLLEAKEVAEVEDALDARQSAGRALLPIVETLEEQIDQAAAGFAPGTREVGLEDPDGPSASAGARARDTAQPALDNTGGGVIVVARYDPPGPTDVAARRATVVGYAVTPLRLSPTLDSLEQDRASLRVLGPLGRVMGAQDEAATPPDDVVAFRLPLDENVAPGWRVEALVPTSPASPAAWLIAAVLMLGGMAVAWVIVRGIRRAEADRAESRRRRRSEAWAAELASVSQSSLDLAEVLPASFAVLEEALDLDGASLVGADAQIDLRVARRARGRRARRSVGGPGARRELRRRTARPRRAVLGSAAGAAEPRAGRARPAHAVRCRRDARPPRSPTPTPTPTSAP